MIASEVLHGLKISRSKGWCFKVDFRKAYDTVQWGALLEIMEAMGFSDKWHGWIQQCVSTARMTVLVNGTLTKEFEMKKGLRQGDPLSPLLFDIVAESLSRLLKKVKERGLISGVK